MNIGQNGHYAFGSGLFPAGSPEQPVKIIVHIHDIGVIVTVIPEGLPDSSAPVKEEQEGSCGCGQLIVGGVWL